MEAVPTSLRGGSGALLRTKTSFKKVTEDLSHGKKIGLYYALRIRQAFSVMCHGDWVCGTHLVNRTQRFYGVVKFSSRNGPKGVRTMPAWGMD